VTTGEAFLRCEVEERQWLAENLALLRLHPPRPLPARAGQFAMLRGAWGSAPLLGRPMSILAAGERIDFLIRRCGEGTSLLTALEAGGPVDLLGPLGRGFGDAPAGCRVVLVAGGCGLPPTLLAARELASAGHRPIFLYGARSATDLVLRDEVAAVAELRVATDDGSEGHGGLVTGLLEGAIADAGDGDPSRAAVWCCGPEAMMRAVARLALGGGSRCLVSVEERMACGRGLCLGCARIDAEGTPRYVCVDGPVFDAAELYGDGNG